MSFLSMLFFHLKNTATQSYFFFLVLMNAVSLLLLQYIGSFANNHLLSGRAVATSVLFGIWNSAVTAAGILHFQRNQGVLVYLVNASKNPRTALLALISSSSTFGLIALPIVFGLAFLLNGCSMPFISSQVVFGMLLFWLSALPITYVLASLFLLSRHAFVYEGLCVLPLLLISGLLGPLFPSGSFLDVLSYLLPMRLPIRLVLFSDWPCWWFWAIWLIDISLFLFASDALFRKILLRIRVSAELEVL
ncbi:hypothetical protein LQZ24_05550 [Fructobacillus sp. M1-13]|uniref:ABC-2 type transporter domain-containing protein n=1 Tax=Fructobacillus papyriferae TaxID=2713171 RepID=A0ABS5QRV8_9LACO|nr:hypothetical protein [Fructobacillus papyriferae]MBS9335054.1 hypothetical protein [Fructobacillus papyriferae]MCD2159460.1 hypothetical protein [Fructobacillus papyriferae]